MIHAPSLDPQSVRIVAEGALTKTGHAYSLVCLTPENIDQIIDLQTLIRDGLSAEQKSFIYPRTRDTYEEHFALGQPMLGLVHDGKLIAQAMLGLPNDDNPDINLHTVDPGLRHEQAAVLMGMQVHPEFRGNNIMSLMVDARLMIAQEMGRTHIVSESEVNNPYSWGVLLKEGMSIKGICHHPYDNAHIYYLHAHIPSLVFRRLHPDFNAAAAKAEIICARTDFNAQKELLDQGYKGVTYNHRTEEIGFAKVTRSPLTGQLRR